jgi:hypothetical protein
MTDERDGEKSTSDLGSWLNLMGAPASITGLMPSEITGLDVAPLMSMLGGVGIKSGVRGADTGETSTDEIRWLPIID